MHGRSDGGGSRPTTGRGRRAPVGLKGRRGPWGGPDGGFMAEACRDSCTDSRRANCGLVRPKPRRAPVVTAARPPLSPPISGWITLYRPKATEALPAVWPFRGASSS